MSIEFCQKKPDQHLSAVGNIKKKQLAEVRTMANPPLPVKMALESVCLLLGEDDRGGDWKAIRAIMVKDSFIASIVKLDTSHIT